MNFLRVIFFGLLQVVELPINSVIDLWKMPGRGRGLVLGMPCVIVLILTLLTIGWAKYGSNEDLVKDYWQRFLKDKTSADALTKRIDGLGKGASGLGDPNESKADVEKPEAGSSAAVEEMVTNHAIQKIQQELYVPERAELPDNPQVIVRAQLADTGHVNKVDVVQTSGWTEWDAAVQAAALKTESITELRSVSKLPPSVDLAFGYDETRREKLRHKMLIGLKKLIDLDPGNPDYKFEYGILAAEMGMLVQAKLVMDQIASPKKPGMCKAHLWQARVIWGDTDNGESTESRLRQCGQHLQLALQADPTNLEAHEGLGEMYFAIRNFAEAEKHYRIVWNEQLSTTLRLVAIYAQQSEKAKLDDLLAQTQVRLEALFAANPTNKIYIFDLERINLMQGQIQKAIDILKENLTAENQAEFRPRLSRIYAEWSKSDAKDNNGIFTAEAFEKAKFALEYDPENAETLLIMTLIGTQGTELAQEAIEIYDPLKNRDTAPGQVLREYAGYLIQQNRMDEAVTWLEDAHLRTPKDPIIANNLAYLLLSAKPPDAERALALASLAINNVGNIPEGDLRAGLCDTKAAALIALNRHAEAIPFLVAALRDRGPNERTLTALRDCYIALRQSDIADGYQRKLDELVRPTEPQK